MRSPDAHVDERRRHERHRVCFPVKLDGEAKADRLGMCRNGSEGGMLFGTPSRFSIGDLLTLTFRVNAQHPGTQVRGRVVWLGQERRHRDNWCRHLVAVAFERPHPDIVPHLANEAPRQAKLFDGAAS